MEHLTAEQLEHYRRGQMAPATMRAVDQHIAACEECRSRLIGPQPFERAAASVFRKAALDARREPNCLDYERVAAYVDDQLDAFDRELVDFHLRDCAQCAEDVRSLRQFRGMMAAQPAVVYRPENTIPLWSSWVPMLRNSVKRQWKFAVAPIAGVLVLGLFCFSQYRTNQSLINRLGRVEAGLQNANDQLRDVQKLTKRIETVQRQAASVQGGVQSTQTRMEAIEGQVKDLQAAMKSAPQVTRVPVTSTEPTTAVSPVPVELQDGAGKAILTADGRVSLPGIPKLTPRWTAQVKELLTKGTVSQPREIQLAMSQVRSDIVVRGFGQGETTEPAPLSPVATAIKTTRPTFHWTPVKSVQSYKLVIANSEQTKVIWESAPMMETHVSLPANVPLTRGEVYAWQVEVTVAGEPKLSAWAKFRVLDDKALAEVTRVETQSGKSAIVLVAVYEAYGLYEDAQKQLENLSQLNPSSQLTQRMLDLLQQQRSKKDAPRSR